MVQGPDGPFLPGYTNAAQRLVMQHAGALGFKLVREMIAQAVAECLRDAVRMGHTFAKGDKVTWWGSYGAQGLPFLAVCVGRHAESDAFMGCLTTDDEAKEAGAPR